MRTCNGEGRFLYQAHLDPKYRFKVSYNMLRHAAAVHALGDYFFEFPSADVGETMVRAAGFMVPSIHPVVGKKGLQALWSEPRIIPELPRPVAKLGGSALALLAMCATERVRRGSMDVRTMRDLARFLLWMQDEDGQWVSLFDPLSSRKQRDWKSRHYAGQAAVALVTLYEMDPDPAWLRGAVLGLERRARDGEAVEKLSPDHWFLIAAERLLRHIDERDFPGTRDLVRRHAVRLAESMLAGVPVRSPKDPAFGCASPDGNIVTTATQLEGWFAALKILPEGSSGLRARLRNATKDGTSFLLRSQVREGMFAGAFPRVIPDPKGNAQYQLLSGALRLDQTQHALSALLNAYKLEKTTSNGLSASAQSPQP